MKQMIAAVAATLLLCSSPAAFAQTAPAPQGGAGQTQQALDMLNGMSPEQRQQLFSSGVSQVQNMSPEQLKQLKAQFDDMTPEQKAQMEGQVVQMMQTSPQIKAQAEQQMKNLTPSQEQALGGNQ
jgi:hypothetical protein